jgi:hypothetical protein
LIDGLINFNKNIFRCSTIEKFDVIPEGELKQKIQGNNKRISNAEISSTTINAVNIFSLFYLEF